MIKTLDKWLEWIKLSSNYKINWEWDTWNLFIKAHPLSLEQEILFKAIEFSYNFSLYDKKLVLKSNEVKDILNNPLKYKNTIKKLYNERY